MIRAQVADVSALRMVFSGFPSGVAAVAAELRGEQHVLVVSSFTVGVSQEPPMVLFAVQSTSSTWPRLRDAAYVGVSVLGEVHAATARQLAAEDKARRLEGVDFTLAESGAIMLHGAPVWMECRVAHHYPAGDHEIVVLEVDAFGSDFGCSPLLWHRSTFARLQPSASAQRSSPGTPNPGDASGSRARCT